MSIQVELRDAELAEHLAKTLTDYEFEMLVRKRIEMVFNAKLVQHDELCTSQFRCYFHYKWEDKCEWNVAIGSTYSNRSSGEGEVLSITVRDAYNAWVAKQDNKLSLLLPAPTTGFEE